jgi:hypothetical protein
MRNNILHINTIGSTGINRFHVQTLTNPKELHVKRVVLAGLGVLALCMSMYVYFVGRIVFDVVARRSAESTIRAHESTVSGLATEYLGKMRTLDLAEAQTLGLSESKHTLYASRKADAAAVGMVYDH